jgi:hypothetical protein
VIFEEGGKGASPASSIVAPDGEAVQKNYELEESFVAPEALLGFGGEGAGELGHVAAEVEGDGESGVGEFGVGLAALFVDEGGEGGAEIGIDGGGGGGRADVDRVREEDELGLVLPEEGFGDFDVGMGGFSVRDGEEAFVFAGVEEIGAVERAGDGFFAFGAAALGADIGVQSGAMTLGFAGAATGADHVQLSAF